MPLLRLAPYEASLLVTLACLVLTWQRRQFPGARFLAGALASQSIYLAGYIGELLAQSLSAKIFWDNFQWLPSLSSLLLLALFVRDYTRLKPLPVWLVFQLSIVPIAMAVLAFTNPWHHYVATGHRIIPGWPTPALHYEFGQAAWLMMPYMVGLVGLSIGTMAVYGFTQHGVFRRQAGVILIGLAIPTVSVFTALFDIRIAGYRDFAPVTSAIGISCILWALLRYQALRLVPMARELVFEHIQVGVLVLDEFLLIIDSNAAAADLFGTTRAALLGQAIASRIGCWPSVVAALKLKRVARLEERHPDQSTVRWVQIDIQPVADAMQSGHLLLLRDITEQKRAAEEVLLSREAALAASQAKSRFVATLSHEIRTPLSSVMGISRLLADSKLEPQQHDLLRKLDGATRHVLELLNHTLDFSKLEAGRLQLVPVAFDLGSLLTSIAELFSVSAADKGLTFSLFVAPEVPHKLYADGLRLKQILVNLVGNAIKFTDQGRVELRVECPKRSPAEAVIEFLVEDSGIGLDEAEQASLFQPFSQADMTISARFGGTGLGLAISHQLAQLLGGELSCQSKKGVGSTFHLRVTMQVSDELNATHHGTTPPSPLMPEPPRSELPQPQAGSSPDPGADGARYRVLLAEDNQLNQIITQKMLRRIGYECDVASTGHDAIQQMISHPPDYYVVVLMDLQMPEMDGKAAVLQIRSDGRFEHVPIIALTGESMDEVILDVLSCGMDDVMHKPVDLKTLSAILQRWVHAKRATSNGPSPQTPSPKTT